MITYITLKGNDTLKIYCNIDDNATIVIFNTAFYSCSIKKIIKKLTCKIVTSLP